MSGILGIDIGGTFTDVVGFDTVSQKLFLTKVPSTQKDYAIGFSQGIEKILKIADWRPEDIIRVNHATTVATNAIIERKGVKVGILTTKGFEDILIIGRQKRTDMYDLFIDAETPIFLAPRSRILGINERIDSKGNILAKLDLEEVKKAASILIKDQGVDSIAVCYLFSFLHKDHEQQTRDIISESYPGVRVSLSSNIDPRFREYERLCVTAFDAYIGPVIERYLKNIQGKIDASGIKAKLQVMQSRGGITSSETIMEKCVTTILSGPAAGVVGSNYLGQVLGEKNLMTIDIGGTSSDAALIQHGRPLLTNDCKVDKYPLRLQMLDVNTIGAGGGGIAWVDESGGLRVGPISAGANPGPSCYGLGGKEPTVTDAGVVLGYLNPNYFAGGEFNLEPKLSEQSIGEKISQKLKMSILDAARGIHKIINSKMAGQLRLISIGRGHDPRKFVLIAFGGAGPVHAGKLAEQLSIKKVVIPISPGVLSAFGLLVVDIEHEEAKTIIIEASQADLATIKGIFKELNEICSKKMKSDDISLSEVTKSQSVDMRYVGQGYEIEVPMPEGEVTRSSIEEVVKRFHQTHDTIYGHHDSESPVEFVNFRAVQAYSPPKPTFTKIHSKGSLSSALKGKREAYFEDYKNPIQTNIYDRWKLPVGEKIKGPSILEQEDTTTVIYPNHNAIVDDYGNLIIEIH